MAESPLRVAVLTSGGDAPGMNAAIRSVARSTIFRGGEAFGVEHGYHGLLAGAVRPLLVGDVGGKLDRGGTFLGTSRSEEFKTPEGLKRAVEVLAEHRINGVVVVGGDGSYRGAEALYGAGVRTVGIPGTIDNDVDGTDTSIGFDTALNTICDAVGKVRDTASSHERTFVIEVMGRRSGLLATYAGLACGADCILVPEIPFEVEDVYACMTNGSRRGKKHCIIVLAEGAGNAFGLANDLSAISGTEVRAVVLGHIQRGGSPSGFDRILASRMGAAAVDALAEGRGGVAVGLRCAECALYPLAEAYGHQHPLREEIYRIAKIMSI